MERAVKSHGEEIERFHHLPDKSPRRREWGNGEQAIFEEIAVEIFQNWKKISPWIDSALWALSRINKNKSTPGHIIVKLYNFREKEPLLSASRGPAKTNLDNSPGPSDSNRSWRQWREITVNLNFIHSPTIIHRWGHNKVISQASLVAQWLRIRLPMQGTQVCALVREDPTCRRATKPVCHNYWACALEPASHNYWSPRATTTEARAPRAPAPQQEKPPQWEARAPQWRVAPARRN